MENIKANFGKDTQSAPRPVKLLRRLILDGLCILLLSFASFEREIFIYLTVQARGQARVLWNSVPLSEFQKQPLTKAVAENLTLVERVKEYSVRELGFKKSASYTRVLDCGKAPVLWVISASEPYAIRPYFWQFPVLGALSYKGYFERHRALKEQCELLAQGWDVDLGTVYAWSGLGFWADPILSPTLERKKGSFCALLFHELFHTTYYAPGQVNLNENLADFVAKKATLQFLEKDTTATREFLEANKDQETITKFMLDKVAELGRFYDAIQNEPEKGRFKARKMAKLVAEAGHLNLRKSSLKKSLQSDLLEHGNAAFIAYLQYRGLQDSLEFAFNKIYRGSLKKMVQALKQN